MAKDRKPHSNPDRAAYDYQSLGEAIKEAFARAGRPVKDLCWELGVSEPMAYAYTSGKHRPSLDVLLAVSELTGTPLGTIVSAGIPAAAKAPYPAWQLWVATGGQTVSKRVLDEMGNVRPPAGREPTVEFYRCLKFAFDAVPERPAPDEIEPGETTDDDRASGTPEDDAGN